MKELYLDANVVLRFLIGEPEGMAKEARSLMEKAEDNQFTLRVQLVVLAEIYWVLFSYYEFSRTRIREVLSQFVRAQGIKAEKESVVLEALDISAEENVDFVDAVLASEANQKDIGVVTFDEGDFGSLDTHWKHPGEIN